jgi:hypothetical protein
VGHSDWVDEENMRWVCVTVVRSVLGCRETLTLSGRMYHFVSLNDEGSIDMGKIKTCDFVSLIVRMHDNIRG